MSVSRWKTLVGTAKYQIYISCTQDPFLNLSIEHYLLQKTSPNSTVLFLYVNKPCVVIGRNQNPWLEVNLGLLKQPPPSIAQFRKGSHFRDVQIVRRRSGGGAVFHDEGNVNYSVICPSASFTRDKHAEMVAQAVRFFNPRARVNERHDIVLDQGNLVEGIGRLDHSDLHKTAFQSHRSLKVSGSAYKMIKHRSLHHGTCLLSSPSLATISQILNSPARPFLKARGVESVRSVVGNIFTQKENDLQNSRRVFENKVIETFRNHYDMDEESSQLFEDANPRDLTPETSVLHSGHAWAAGKLGIDLGSITEIREGVKELTSLRWIYGQTPQFTLSSHAHEEDIRERPPLPSILPPCTRVYLKARGGAFTETKISTSADDASNSEIRKYETLLKGRFIHEIHDFEALLASSGENSSLHMPTLGRWLNTMFGNRA